MSTDSSEISRSVPVSPQFVAGSGSAYPVAPSTESTETSVAAVSGPSQQMRTNAVAKESIRTFQKAIKSPHDNDWNAGLIDPKEYLKIVEAMNKAISTQIEIERQQKKIKQAMMNISLEFRRSLEKRGDAL